MTDIITLDRYTGAWLRDISDAAELSAGTGHTVDGREWDDFYRRATAAGLRGEYSTTVDGWDHYELVEAES